MSPDEYMARVRKALKGIPAEQQEILLEEIAGHLAEIRATGDEDLETEMGAPEELARRMKQVHRPNRWVDYVLVALPETYTLSPVILFLSILLFPAQTVGSNTPGMDIAWAIRMSVFLHTLMVIASLWRYRKTGVPGLLLYWLPAAWLTIFSLCFREQRWLLTSAVNASPSGLLETIFWLAVLTVMGVWLVRWVVKSRDAQLLVMAVLPFLFTTGNVASSEVILAGGFPNGYVMSDWPVISWLTASQLARFLWPILFYMFPQRPVRWLGLLLRATPVALMNLFAAGSHPELVAVWSLPFLLVLAGWLIDRPAGRRPSGLPE